MNARPQLQPDSADGTETGIRLGVDVGGTFTDFTIVASDGTVHLWKEESTPANPVEGIRTGLVGFSKHLGIDVRDLLKRCHLCVHGTTVGTNMLIERTGPRLGLLCTEGFRDTLYFRDGYKAERFNLGLQHPKPLVDRWLRLGIPERVDDEGNELIPLDEDAVITAARFMREAGVEAVAIAFLWSIVAPGHELRAAELVRRELSGASVVCSHAVLPEIREWERTSATVLSAYLLEALEEYLTGFESYLMSGGHSRKPLIMQINGGCSQVSDILRRPINILHSGPAAAPSAAAFFSSTTGPNVVTVDMGGTSLDVCLIRNGRPTMSRFVQVADQPIGVSAVDVHTIGAGGGSIAWVDAGGALRVGPRSAGARPGPAAYGYGGMEPTVTDANVVLGYLHPEAFLGGRRRLELSKAALAIDECVARPLSITPLEAALGIVRIVNSNIETAVRVVSVERGIDPRSLSLVCGGGAGGLHCAAVARGLEIRRVFVPREAGVFCSFGMTVTDVRQDRTVSFHAFSDDLDVAKVESLMAQIESQLRLEFQDAGYESDAVVFERTSDARYPGQHHEITIPIPSPLRVADIKAVEASFHGEHALLYAYDREELPVEFFHWRVTGIGRHPTPARALTAGNGSSPKPARELPVHFAENPLETPFYSVETLGVGATVKGPAVIEAPTTTIVVPPGDVLTMETADGYTIEVAPKEPNKR